MRKKCKKRATCLKKCLPPAPTRTDNVHCKSDVDGFSIWLFVTTVISQGSVATRLRCGGQCDSQFVANLLMNSTMEKFRKSVNICQSYGQKYRGPFLTHSVALNLSDYHVNRPEMKKWMTAGVPVSSKTKK